MEEIEDELERRRIYAKLIRTVLESLCTFGEGKRVRCGQLQNAVKTALDDFAIPRLPQQVIEVLNALGVRQTAFNGYWYFAGLELKDPHAG